MELQNETLRDGLASAAELNEYVDRLLREPALRISARRARLLRYLAQRTLAGEADQINEYAIGIDVFEKSIEFDPKLDATVRAEISRLRRNLGDYYAGAGQTDPLRITLPARGYFLSFTSVDGIAATEIPGENPPALAQPIPASPASARSVSFQKKSLWMVAGALALAAVTVTLLVLERPRHADHIESLVVLPFRDFSSDRHSGYLADGLTDELTDYLANVKGLRVIARTTAFQFKDKAMDVREIGRRLKVDASLEGSIDREGNHIHVRAQLNRTADGYHLWSRVYDSEVQDLIAVQRDLARWIADDVQAGRSSAPSPVPPGATANPEAHDLYLRGLDLYDNSSVTAGFEEGIRLMQAAIAKDPHYAAPWFVMAKMRETTGWLLGWPPGVEEQVRTDLEQALERDPKMADAHADLGIIDWDYDYDWPRAEREFQLALEPADREEPHKLYGWALADRGRFAESEKHLQMAEDIAPENLELLFIIGGVQMWERKFAESERTLHSMLQLNPNSITALATLVTLKIIQNDCTGAAEYASRLERVDPTTFRAVFARAAVDVCEGNKSGAVTLLDRQSSRLRNVPAFELAKLYAFMGDKDRAIQYLEQAVDRHEFGATSMKQQPYLKSLQEDPRFLALESRLGLSE